MDAKPSGILRLNKDHWLAKDYEVLCLVTPQHKVGYEHIRGQIGVEVGTSLSVNALPYLGQCLKSTSGAASALKFQNSIPAVARTRATFFAIIQPTNVASVCSIGSDSTDAGGWRWEIGNTSGELSMTANGVGGNTSSGLAIAANRPYFVATSFISGTTVNYVARELNSGIYRTSTSASGGGVTTPDGGFDVAGARLGAASFGFAGSIAMFGIAQGAVPISQLLEMAREPWGIVSETPARKFYFTNAPSGATNFPVTLSPGAHAFAGSSLTVTVQKNITLSTGARAFAGSNLTETVGKQIALSTGARAFAGSNLTVSVTTSTTDYPVTLSPGARAFAGSPLTVTVKKNITLSAGARTFAGSSLTETVTKVIGLAAGARAFAGSNLNEQAPINIALGTGARAFTGSALTFNIIGSGGGKDGHGLKSNNRLPYGWWADPEYNPKLRSKKPLTEAEKEVIREAVDETQETGEPASLAANLLAGLVQPYEQNDRIDWSSINRSADEIKALRQGIAQYRKELQAQQEEDDDEEALLMIAH